MAFRVMGRSEDIFQGYTKRKGLEGPFAFAGNRILYYDALEGAYYDPKTDFYVDQAEMNILHDQMIKILSN